MLGVVQSKSRSLVRTPVQQFCRHASSTFGKQQVYSSGNKKYEHKLNELKHKNRLKIEPVDNAETQQFLHDFTTLESQMRSLKNKGFLRKYLSYAPPADVQTIFLKTCSSVLGKGVTACNLNTHKLQDPDVKFELMNSLGKELNHYVHNSRLRDMDDLDKLFIFYTTPIDMKNPYTRLCDEGEAGKLPPNLIIQKNPLRFTGKGDHRLDQVTAYPRSPTIVSGLYARDKFKAADTELDPYSELDYE
jgi:hypothetical protein